MSTLNSFRTLEEYQVSVRQAGARVYHHLTEAQKSELKSMILHSLDKPLSTTTSNDATAGTSSSWKDFVEKTTEEIIIRKVESGEAVDANAVVDEVLPLAHARVPEEVRRELFLRISQLASSAKKQKVSS